VVNPFRRKRPFAAVEGGFAPNLSADERELLSSLPTQLRELLGANDGSSTRRLFPAAYNNDPERDAEFHELMREDLVETKMRSAQALADTARLPVLTEDQLLAWMGAVNDLRLVIGTQLDVQEDTERDLDPDHPDGYRFLVYGWLSQLLERIVRALAGDEGYSEFYEGDDLENHPSED
jgi:Domain of unknown function (DUF2017)